MTYRDMAYQLQDMQREERRGRGIDCVRTVVSYLYRDDFTSAKAACLIEWNKIRNYPEIAQYLSVHLLKYTPEIK